MFMNSAEHTRRHAIFSQPMCHCMVSVRALGSEEYTAQHVLSVRCPTDPFRGAGHIPGLRTTTPTGKKTMLESREGQTVPDVTFPIRVGDAWQKISSDAVFKGKTVVLFALPGAFTPTCSRRHLPRYNELAGVLKANGVDSVVCLAVNDPFVMETQSPGPQSGRC